MKDIYIIRLYSDLKFKGKLYLHLEDCQALRYVWEAMDEKNYVSITKII